MIRGVDIDFSELDYLQPVCLSAFNFLAIDQRHFSRGPLGVNLAFNRGFDGCGRRLGGPVPQRSKRVGEDPRSLGG